MKKILIIKIIIWFKNINKSKKNIDKDKIIIYIYNKK